MTFALSQRAAAGRRRCVAGRAQGRERRDRRPQRLGQDHAARAAPALLRSAAGPDPDRRRRCAQRDAAQRAAADRHRHAGERDLPRHDRGEHRVRPAAARRARPDRRRRASARSATNSSWKSRRATTRRSTAWAGSSPADRRQRLNIARAILRQTPILILDEATSQVDAESEHLIQTGDRIDDAEQDGTQDRTTFVIAHRFRRSSPPTRSSSWIEARSSGRASTKSCCGRARRTSSCTSGNSFAA